ncbi:MAG TPA: efflux RND transporter permease subunit [Thermoanaerobaculia bacterium]|nr:efflux RND transporter permease subunit [Thermoanaerobaculia bacterium]
MNISELFIRRPVATTLVMLGILFFGIVGYRLLPVSDLPNVDFPTIQVTAALPGASPETMASAVATPLEKQFTTIAGLDNMTSTSILGVTQVTLQFSLSRSLDGAAQDVQAAIGAASRQLPPGMPTPPTYQKVNPADQPILYIALTTPTLPLSLLDEYAETMMAQRISTVSGVAQVLVYGSQKYAVRVQLDPRALAYRGIGIDEASAAVASANVNIPTGTLWGANTAYTVMATGQLTEAAQYGPLIIAYRNGSPVRVNDVGRALDGTENDKTASWYVDKAGATRSIVLAIQKQPGENTVEVVSNIRKLLPQFQAALPGSAKLNILFDRSQSIRDSVADVKFTLWLTLALVVLVIFLFLRNLSATVIPSLALPLSISGTFAAMYVLGYSMDNLSLMALTLSVGFVVDDAIVVLENIVRHLEMGEKPFEAALNGTKEIGFTIVSMTISLAAVFIPLLFMGGIIGRLFREFAVTIAVAILVSGFVSLTLTPMLCARYLRAHGTDDRHGRLYEASERVFAGSLAFYDRGLTWALGHRRTMMLFSAAVLAATAWLFVRVPKGFLPADDTGQVFAPTEAAQGISFESMVEHQKAVAAIVAEDPGVDGFMSSCGNRGNDTRGGNTGTMFMRLKPRSERPPVDVIIQRLRPKLARVPGIRVYPQVPPPIRLGGNLTRAQYQFTLQASDTKDLYASAPTLEEKLRSIKGLQDVNSDLQLRNPTAYLTIDRDRASALGVTPESLENALYTAYGSRQISTIYTPNNEYQVIMELLPEFQRDPSAFQLLYVRSRKGDLVPLSALTRLDRTVGPLAVNHAGQLPAVTLSFNLAPGVSLGEAVAEISKVARASLPATVQTSFQGTAQAFEASQKGLGLLLLVAILVIYMVLGILYEDFLHPITILSALPFAGFGALLTLLIFRTELSIYAFVGVILLVGLVKKNGIMMVDFAVEARRAGKSAEEAIHEACVVRFRPIMMTTMAALMGTLPIALGFGAGAESRRPLGLAVVGGLLFSQMITLYVTPVFYVYMDSLDGWIRRRGRRSAGDAADGAPAHAGG